jgi:hypothetical protein
MHSIRIWLTMSIIASFLGGCAIPRNDVDFSAHVTAPPSAPAPSFHPEAPQVPSTTASATAASTASSPLANTGATGESAEQYLNLMPMSSLRQTDTVSKTSVNYSDRYTRVVIIAHGGCADLRATQRCSQPWSDRSVRTQARQPALTPPWATKRPFF